MDLREIKTIPSEFESCDCVNGTAQGFVPSKIAEAVGTRLLCTFGRNTAGSQSLPVALCDLNLAWPFCVKASKQARQSYSEDAFPLWVVPYSMHQTRVQYRPVANLDPQKCHCYLGLEFAGTLHVRIESSWKFKQDWRVQKDAWKLHRY